MNAAHYFPDIGRESQISSDSSDAVMVVRAALARLAVRGNL